MEILPDNEKKNRQCPRWETRAVVRFTFSKNLKNSTAADVFNVKQWLLFHFSSLSGTISQGIRWDLIWHQLSITPHICITF